MTRTVHKKTEIIEEYTDGGSNFKIIFGILLGIGIGAFLVYAFSKKYQKNIGLSSDTKYISNVPKSQQLLLADNHNNEKWKIVRNESGGIEEIEILKSNAQNNIQSIAEDILKYEGDNKIVLKPENISIHKHI